MNGLSMLWYVHAHALSPEDDEVNSLLSVMLEIFMVFVEKVLYWIERTSENILSDPNGAKHIIRQSSWCSTI